MISSLHIILILLSLFVFSGCTDDLVGKKAPVATKGLMDLREWDFSKDGPIKLNGEWEFYWKKLLITQEINSPNPPVKTGNISVPQSWKNFKIDGKKVGDLGYASYRLKILTGNKNTPLTFRFFTLNTAYNFYVNNHKLAFAGMIGTEKASAKPEYKPQVCTYVPGVNEKELVLTLEVSNFHEINGGFLNIIQMGHEKDIWELREKSLVFNFFMFGCIFTMGLYHLGLFALRRKDNSTICFTCFCFLTALRILVLHDERYFTTLFPGINWFVLHKLDYWTYSLGIAVLFPFLRALFPDEFSKKYINFIVFISLGYTLIILITPPIIYGSILYIFEIMTILFSLYAIRCIALAAKHKRIGAKAISVGFFIVFVTAINDILHQNQIIYTGYIVSIGTLVLLLSQAFVISVRFSRAFSLVESLEAKYRNIYENAIEGIYQCSLSGKLINANPAFAKILGYKATANLIQSISGKMNAMFLNPSKMNEIREQLLNNKTLQNFETQLYKHDGTPIWALCNAKAIKSPEGKLTHIEGMILDITERKQVEKEIKKARDAAESANEIKSQFLANMSHEIRTPLTGVIGMADLLYETPLNHEQYEYARTIRTSSSFLLNIVNDILDFSKIEAGQLDLEKINFDLNVLIDQVHGILSGQALEKKLKFNSHLNPETPVLLNGDPDRLKQVLINIAGNAIKFTHQGSVSVSVKSESENDSSSTLLFTIQDTGIGIPESRMDKLFVMFSQADITMSRKYGGTGLGLAISKELVELMGGEIGVISTEGKGSVFHFKVILKKQVKDNEILKAKNSKSKTPLVSLAGKPGIRILVVEDNPVNQMYATKLLSKMGYITYVAGNGQKAIEQLSSDTFDLVLMDIQMPVMDGFIATQTIRDINSTVIRHDIPIIAMTAHAMKEDREKCLKVGMDDYLTKPFKPLKLAEVIEHHLTKSPG